jgi:nitroimidazol reductase NimA-like FMN-containing flavoprotein (pyridoxamine 5'-phosphate oxidase superfamily)
MDFISGPWDRHTVDLWLREARIPVRLGLMRSTGPLVLSLWYRFDGVALWCATDADADVVAHLSSDPRVAFEVGPDVPPYRGVRGTGVAQVLAESGAAELDRLISRYLDDENAQLAEWLRDRAQNEVAIRIDGLRVTSWDFSGRMSAQADDPRLPEPMARR